ncbi:MAG TPA: molybdopterin-binding protein [Paenalcaligenes sp.]|nr:molybdopterin-binding protein [Paenalcaligenes sp.]
MATISLKCAVLTISSDPERADNTGDFLQEALTAAGHQCVARERSNGCLYNIRKHLSQWIADTGVEVILCNGGTGYGEHKNTVPAARALFDEEVSGFGELFRALSYADIGSGAIQSEALAGLANDKVIFCVPGSEGAAKLAWRELIQPQLDEGTTPCNFARHCAG